MNQSMKPRIDFSETPAEQRQAELKTAIEFEPSDVSAFIPDPAIDETEQAETQEISEIPTVTHLGGKPGLWRKMVTVGLVILGMRAIAQGGEWVYQAWQNHNWISFGTAMAGGCIIIAGAGALISDWRNFYKLRERAQERDEGHRLLHSHSMGRGRIFCEKLARQAGLDNQHPAMQRWLAACHETHNDREVVMLYAQLVQSAIDQSVRREISRSAAEAALMVAVSPLAIVDMAFIAWRNLRLVKRIAAMYGIQPGYWGRIRLFRLVLFNMAFAGVTELIREAGMDWISQDVAARFSARAAQGIGVGLLTARLGIKTMELCRPLPWLVNDRPRLGDFRNQLVAQLKEALAGKKTPGSDKRHQ